MDRLSELRQSPEVPYGIGYLTGVNHRAFRWRPSIAAVAVEFSTCILFVSGKLLAEYARQAAEVKRFQIGEWIGHRKKPAAVNEIRRGHQQKSGRLKPRSLKAC
jgi:hypothetical protein